MKEKKSVTYTSVNSSKVVAGVKTSNKPMTWGGREGKDYVYTHTDIRHEISVLQYPDLNCLKQRAEPLHTSVWS